MGWRYQDNSSPGRRVAAGWLLGRGGLERLHQWELRCCCTRSSPFMLSVETLRLINESDGGGGGEAQLGNGPEERGQLKWGICL